MVNARQQVEQPQQRFEQLRQQEQRPQVPLDWAANLCAQSFVSLEAPFAI
jgi:hypothetical protein